MNHANLPKNDEAVLIIFGFLGVELYRYSWYEVQTKSYWLWLMWLSSTHLWVTRSKFSGLYTLQTKICQYIIIYNTKNSIDLILKQKLSVDESKTSVTRKSISSHNSPYSSQSPVTYENSNVAIYEVNNIYFTKEWFHMLNYIVHLFISFCISH